MLATLLATMPYGPIAAAAAGLGAYAAVLWAAGTFAADELGAFVRLPARPRPGR
jgi:hypothetical protein